MTQTVIGIFDTTDAAYDVEETLMDQEGIEESCFHIAAQEGSMRESGQPGQSMDEIRNFLVDLFGPENQEQVDYYATQIARGGALLSVDLPDDIEIEPIRETMLNAGAIDMDERHLDQAQEQARPGESAAPQAAREESQAIPLVQEEMNVGKRKEEKGSVRVTSRMEETPVQQNVKLTEETASIRTRPVDRPATAEDIESMGTDAIEVRETAERPVVSKTARVVEEVEVAKETSERTEAVKDTVRHTEVNVEKQAPKGSSRKRGK